jgi:putative DNA methylase
MSAPDDQNPRLIEVAFPLQQTSLDSLHEKNVRHGHISTLHIWPARRPLAACRAALIATLLPDPGDQAKRRELLEKIGGKVVEKVTTETKNGRTIKKVKYETSGGVLHWGNENSPDMDWFRSEIKKAYGGRAPRVLDPFAGGGAIPLEAMRLGCEVTAIDINPVAWFILKCTLEYPQKLAGQTRPLPDFAKADPDFLRSFLENKTGRKATTVKARATLADEVVKVQQNFLPLPEADLAWHVRAWGGWVLAQARQELARFYPTIDNKPTVAYLWARTVACKQCRATLPLLKTRWLCKKDNKRVRLTMDPAPDQKGVVFGIETSVPVVGGNATQKREHDKRIAAGTMSRAGACCPCCDTVNTMADIRFEGKAGRLGTVMTAVVVDGPAGKEYRLPTPKEIALAEAAAGELDRVYADVPFGIPDEPTPLGGGTGASRAFSVYGYGMTKWRDLFTPRQLLALGTFVRETRLAKLELEKVGYSSEWVEALINYLAIALDKLCDRQSVICRWDMGYSKVNNTFSRFALPIVWDFCEGNPLSNTTGNYQSCYNWVCEVVEHCTIAAHSPKTIVSNISAIKSDAYSNYDFVITDPPYYDAIPYSDLMDFFFVWQKRVITNIGSNQNKNFNSALCPKWDGQSEDGELIDDSSRHGGDKHKSKQAYEDGMAKVFQNCFDALTPEGRFVVVFANKQPDAWETLVSAIIRAGFVVDGSWPIQTEMGNRTRAMSSAALSSSVWLVCKKRSDVARPGWDQAVRAEMRSRVGVKLREFWDAGIRGPDLVWSATGPALEAFSRHPVVKRSDRPNEALSVGDFLREVRKLVVDFVVGWIINRDEAGAAPTESGLDSVTAYYVLHRHDFGLASAPIGPCILYAISCGLRDTELADRHEILIRSGGTTNADDDDENEATDDDETNDEAEETATGSGSEVKLKPWNQRRRRGLGDDTEGRPAPMIDKAHRLMQLWRAGDVAKVNDYVETHTLRRDALFKKLVQALIELAEVGSEERSTLEAVSNHLGTMGDQPRRGMQQVGLGFANDN